MNREICSQDIEDFEYTPKSSYPGPFMIYNEDNEKSVLMRFFELMREYKPHVYVTYNGTCHLSMFHTSYKAATGVSFQCLCFLTFFWF